LFEERRLIFLLIFILIFLFPACSLPPSKDSVKEAITKYFEDKNYSIADIDIGEIKPMPMSAQQYMGKKGYLVEIKSITLEATENVSLPVQNKKGEKLTFSNTAITIREKNDKKGDWIISNISGIPII
jgi:hypothetical protein